MTREDLSTVLLLGEGLGDVYPSRLIIRPACHVHVYALVEGNSVWVGAYFEIKRPE